ncbi:hypothetical protein LSS_13679 [Leptospira santarosai serovar Shermani str. LT 821]|uniref:Uncharacterized protein n=1 Tax=Leptospira santarosai serovar Shermani str. LT 821 TaxID=758847 RepID=K8XXS8_9LEPT|nr:hypothetical protein LSS_13679 [Leptospira santarosai serovar Shermani str. LT 821]
MYRIFDILEKAKANKRISATTKSFINFYPESSDHFFRSKQILTNQQVEDFD